MGMVILIRNLDSLKKIGEKYKVLSIQKKNVR